MDDDVLLAGPPRQALVDATPGISDHAGELVHTQEPDSGCQMTGQVNMVTSSEAQNAPQAGTGAPAQAAGQGAPTRQSVEGGVDESNICSDGGQPPPDIQSVSSPASSAPIPRPPGGPDAPDSVLVKDDKLSEGVPAKAAMSTSGAEPHRPHKVDIAQVSGTMLLDNTPMTVSYRAPPSGGMVGTMRRPGTIARSAALRLPNHLVNHANSAAHDGALEAAAAGVMPSHIGDPLHLAHNDLRKEWPADASSNLIANDDDAPAAAINPLGTSETQFKPSGGAAASTIAALASALQTAEAKLAQVTTSSPDRGSRRDPYTEAMDIAQEVHQAENEVSILRDALLRLQGGVAGGAAPGQSPLQSRAVSQTGQPVLNGYHYEPRTESAASLDRSQLRSALAPNDEHARHPAHAVRTCGRGSLQHTTLTKHVDFHVSPRQIEVSTEHPADQSSAPGTAGLRLYESASFNGNADDVRDSYLSHVYMSIPYGARHTYTYCTTQS
jgi:hypothetical protein